jgi:hypothetical protein
MPSQSSLVRALQHELFGPPHLRAPELPAVPALNKTGYLSGNSGEARLDTHALARPATSLGVIRGSSNARTPDPSGLYPDKKVDVHHALYSKRALTGAPVHASSNAAAISEMNHSRSTEAKHSVHNSESENQHGILHNTAGIHPGGENRDTGSKSTKYASYHMKNSDLPANHSYEMGHTGSVVGPSNVVVKKMVKSDVSPGTGAWKSSATYDMNMRGAYDMNMRVELLRLVDDVVKMQGMPKDLGRVQGRAPVRRFGGRPKSPRK